MYFGLFYSIILSPAGAYNLVGLCQNRRNSQETNIKVYHYVETNRMLEHEENSTFSIFFIKDKTPTKH